MTNRELQAKLSTFPANMLVVVEGEAEFTVEVDDTTLVNGKPQAVIHIESLES